MAQPLKHRFLCCNQETLQPLVWKQYGYWHADVKRNIVYPPPEWMTEDCLARCEDLVAHLNEPNLQITVETKLGEVWNDSRGNPGRWCANWILFDPNNQHIEADRGGVVGCKTEESAKAYAMERYYTLKGLYDGDVEALLVYKRTGVVCLPNWNTNNIDSWGFKRVNGRIVKTRIPRANEVAKLLEQRRII